MGYEKVPLGRPTKSTCTFTDGDDDPYDPETVKVVVTAPGEDPREGDGTEYEYTVDAEVIRESLGVYSITTPSTDAGEWQHRWIAEGDGATGAEPVRYKVRNEAGEVE